jgi:hypothetical protein
LRRKLHLCYWVRPAGYARQTGTAPSQPKSKPNESINRTSSTEILPAHHEIVETVGLINPILKRRPPRAGRLQLLLPGASRFASRVNPPPALRSPENSWSETARYLDLHIRVARLDFFERHYQKLSARLRR